MYPDQSQQAPPPPPFDYLNQIAPQAPKRGPFQLGLKQIILLGLGLVVVVGLLSIIIGVITAGNGDPVQRLTARLSATETIVNDSQANLKSSKLRSLNSNLRLYMTNTNRDIVTPLKNAGVDAKKISSGVLSQESTTDLASRLEDARLNAVFDRTYAREMAFQLGTTMTLMTQIYNSTNSASMKQFLTTAYENLKPTQEAFANFSTAE